MGAVPGSELITASSLDLLMRWAGTGSTVDWLLSDATVWAADDTLLVSVRGHGQGVSGGITSIHGGFGRAVGLSLLQSACAHVQGILPSRLAACQ